MLLSKDERRIAMALFRLHDTATSRISL